MSEDDLHFCTICGTQLQEHSLAVRDDGAVVAQGLFDGIWFTCGESQPERDVDPRSALAYEYP